MKIQKMIGAAVFIALYLGSFALCHLAMNWAFEGYLDPAQGERGFYIFVHIVWMGITAAILEAHAETQGLRADAADYVHDLITSD